MDGPHPIDMRTRYPGQQQIQSLADATLHALERAGLHDVVDDLKLRVLDRQWEEVCDLAQIDGDAWQISYKPMIELLLYEIKHVARAPHVSDDDRRIRIEWAMTLAGV
jgi:hypothetical protein